MGEDTISEAAGRRHIIKRPRLTRMLDEATARIICLVAPAGYGKTTLAREWLEQGGRRSAWYAGGPASADVAALAAGLGRAVASIVPGADRRLTERLRAAGQPQEEAELLAELLAEDLASWPDDAWLFVDDYHCLMAAEPAERFFDVLVGNAPVRLILASRQRPTWATPRRILYGEIHELGTNTLAFTIDEAREVLAQSARANASGLIQLADGWPAVLGLAALSEEDAIPDPDLPNALYDYFADELYQKADESLQRTLCELALIPSLTREVVEALLGEKAEAVFQRSTELGFLTPERDTSSSMHPLLRTFLAQKLATARYAVRAAAIGQVLRVLLHHARWDDAFGIVERFDARGFLNELLRHALPPMLEDGRLATINRWLEYAREVELDSPIVDLAEAEIALRGGAYKQAEVLAHRAAQGLDPLDPLSSPAWVAAARAAHLADRAVQALGFSREAELTATTTTDLAKALWMRFVQSAELERLEAASVLDRLRALPDNDVNREFRIATGSAVLARRQGSLDEAASSMLEAKQLYSRINDPMLRSVFLNELGYILVLRAHYQEGLKVAAESLAEAEHYRLKFVVPHAWLNLALAHLGLRQFTRVEALLPQIAEVAGASHDGFLSLSARNILARLLVAKGKAEAALQELLAPPPRPTNVGLAGEYHATRALAAACSGAFAEALREADIASAKSRQAETQALARCARAVVALLRGDVGGKRHAHDALIFATTSGNFDAFVCAYRGCPDLLLTVCTPTTSRQLARLLDRANDHALARRAALTGESPYSATSSLTRRETEVYELLGQGLTNREIAETLFISEVTVKVHAKHIYEKLGLRSRTQVALHAAHNKDLA